MYKSENVLIAEAINKDYGYDTLTCIRILHENSNNWKLFDKASKYYLLHKAMERRTNEK